MTGGRLSGAALFLLGLLSVIAQVLLIREFIGSFLRQRIFIGWLFFSWFFWTASGSRFAGSRFKESSMALRALAGTFFAVGIFIFLQVFLVRSSRFLLGIHPGEVPDLLPALVYSFLVMAPLCFFFGMQFPLALRSLGAGEMKMEAVFGRAYFLESLGFITGGILFSFLLVRCAPFCSLAVIGFLSLGMASAILFREALPKMKIALGLILTASIAGFLFSNSFEYPSASLRFPSERLEKTLNTVHGNIAVTRLGDQFNFYQSGGLIGSAREQLASELLVHLPMLAHPSPEKVLLLGTGFNGPLPEVLKYGAVEVTNVDIDPELVRVAERYLPGDLRSALCDKRVRIANGDPRAFLDSSEEKWDVVIMNFPDPGTVLLNRNFTVEFFQKIKKHLAPEGIFALRLDFSPNYISPELERLGSSVYATLHQVFPSVTVLPEDTAYFLASTEGRWIPPLEKMIERLRAKDIGNSFVTSGLIRDRITNSRALRVQTIFENALHEVKNTDRVPRSCYFSLVRWISHFHSGLSRRLLDLSEVPFGFVAVFFLFLFGFPFLPGNSDPSGRARRFACGAVRISGFSIMVFEIILIYLFQVCYGDLYYRIAWLITAFMTGMAAGALIGIRKRSSAPQRILRGIHLMAVFFYGGMVFLLSRNSCFLIGTHGAVFYGLAFLGGGWIGFEFPFANALYLDSGKGEKPGAVYAADLTGSCLGAFCASGFLIPIWGVPRTLVLIALLNGVVFLFLFFRKDLGSKDV